MTELSDYTLIAKIFKQTSIQLGHLDSFDPINMQRFTVITTFSVTIRYRNPFTTHAIIRQFATELNIRVHEIRANNQL